MPPGARIQHEGDNRVHPIPTRRAIAKALAFACAGAPFSALAQTVSEKQTRIIVPFPPGGGTDANARLIGSKLSDIFGMPVVLDNRTGASGTIGITAAAKLPADGRNLVLGQADNLAVAPLLIKGVPYDPLTSLTPIAHVADVPILIDRRITDRHFNRMSASMAPWKRHQPAWKPVI